LKSLERKPLLFTRKSGELPLSGPALAELLRAVLDKGKPFRFRAKGSSMSPFLKDGDVITVSPLAGAPPRLGEVVAYLLGETGKLAVHRVIGKRRDGYLIWGDNVLEKQERVPGVNVLGRVTRVERNGKDAGLGLGPERIVIALLRRYWLLRTAIHLFLRIARPVYGWRQGPA
jgi:hypothetical protein